MQDDILSILNQADDDDDTTIEEEEGDNMEEGGDSDGNLDTGEESADDEDPVSEDE